MPLSQHKWRQFLEEAQLRWPLLNAETESMQSPTDVAIRLRQAAGLSDSRSQREVKDLVASFEEKVRRTV
jgi:hypothetical protein